MVFSQPWLAHILAMVQGKYHIFGCCMVCPW